MAKPKQTILSKSKLMLGFQCTKHLWLALNESDKGAEADVAQQMQFDEGNEVGELARTYAGPGLLIETDHWEFQKAHDLTQAAIKNGERLIFEASFLGEGIYARADILKKDKKGWHLIEVKKSGEVKDYHYQDAGVQAFLIESTGLKLASVSIMHINTKAVYPDLTELFHIADVTKEIKAIQAEIKKMVPKFLKVAVAKAHPKVEIGPHCGDPFECPFKDHCWEKVPEKSVFDLPGLKDAKALELYNKGIKAIKQLDPADYKGNTRRAIEATKSNKTFVDKAIVENELSEWKWPLYFFDFETINPAVPRYNGTRPYTKTPFQFSCHVWGSAKQAKLTHFEYLHQEASDPRPGIIQAMLGGLGTKGSIVSYNKGFEIGVIKTLAEFDKKNSKALLALVDRFVDPLPIFRKAVYHPDFCGSFSIKSVAPALLGEKLSYENLAVGDGGTAQAFAEQILRSKITGSAKAMVVVDLLKYCQQDTIAMVELVKWLKSEAD